MTSPPETLEPIQWLDGDEYRDPLVYRSRERFWWHARIAEELRTRANHGHPAMCVKAIAGNIRGMYVSDCARYIRMMLTWGELVQAEPLYDFEPDTWVAIAPAERERSLETQTANDARETEGT